MSLPKRLTLDAWAPRLEGCGEKLEITCQAMQSTKSGRVHSTKLRLKADRYWVRQLAEEIAKMQQRDRERLASEVARITSEVAPLVSGRD